MLCIFLSAFFAILAFPNIFFFHGLPSFIWIFAVPLFFVLEQKDLRRRILNGLCFGLLFYACLVRWMTAYNLLGYYAFVIALTISPVVFACFWRDDFKNKWTGLFYTPALWVASESLRPFLFNGFSWNLGVSQSFNVYAVQMADIFGSAGISFVIILVNYALFRIMKGTKAVSFYACAAAAAVGLMYMYGYGTLHFKHFKPTRPYAVCSVQPLLDPHKKLNHSLVPAIIDEHVALTPACLQEDTDLIVWPETAVPDDFRRYVNLQEKITATVQSANVPFLIGAALWDNDQSFNSAVLLNKNGDIADIYQKQNLVPFSEYKPFKKAVDGLSRILGVKGHEFGRGEGLGLMYLPDDNEPFGVGICSEDIYSGTIRHLARAGAGFLVIVLNDGWFIHPEALIMHAQNSVLRAVENRRPVIRAANSGWTCLIDPYGRIISEVPFNAKTAVRFYVSPQYQDSFYTKYGHLFGVVCLGFVILTVIGCRAKFLKGED